ncbi:MAG: 50S ribosomal protein L24 [Patescibacteria group bacterium]|nr:50S ribosomal protein L24 [Patescibacteria group bacterium]
MKIKKGDKVRIISGKDKGREGIIEKVYLKANKVLISGINLYKRHIKKSEKFPQGGVVEIPRPLLVSKVMLICPKCHKLTRVGFEKREKKKWRICKKCREKI